MSYAESPVETVKKFAKTTEWQRASVEVITSDFFCISNKTNLEWDPYYYEEKEGKMFDPVRQKFVKDSAGNDQVEKSVNDQLEKWFLSHESGLAVWISPRGGNWQYPEEKIAIHRIAYKINGQKVLLCSSHQFNTRFKNPEEIRRFIFTEDDKEESVFEIIKMLQKISQKKVGIGARKDLKESWALAQNYAREYISGTPIETIIYHMTQTEFLGQNPIGCAGTSTLTSVLNPTETITLAFGYQDEYGSLQFACPKCGAINTRPFGHLISNCQLCGGDVRC